MTWMTLHSHPISDLHAYFHVLGLEVVPYSYENVSECLYITCIFVWMTSVLSKMGGEIVLSTLNDMDDTT